MSLKSTIEYLGEWELLYNPNFNCTEFDTIKNAAGIKIDAKLPPHEPQGQVVLAQLNQRTCSTGNKKKDVQNLSDNFDTPLFC